MTRADDRMSIEELREFVEHDPRGTWVDPAEGTSMIIFGALAPRATNGRDAPLGWRDE